LVTKVRETWSEWLGTVAMLQVFRRKFEPGKLGREFQEYTSVDYGKKPCEICGGVFTVPKSDGSYIWCRCPEAEVMRKEDPEWVDKLNKTRT